MCLTGCELDFFKLFLFLVTLESSTLPPASVPMGKCSHSAALMILAIHNLSSTYVEYQWKKPDVPSDKVKELEELFPVWRYKPLTHAATPVDRKWLLSQFHWFTGISWLLTPEPEIQQEPLFHFSTDCIITRHWFPQWSGWRDTYH